MADKNQTAQPSQHLRPMTRCQILPLPGRQFQLLIDGNERTRWHFPSDVPRPYFYPINGPGNVSLTRMGHPGAPNHDHHRSFWFAHHDLLGIDFWSENTDAVIEQTQWHAIEEDDASATVAFRLVWRDGHDPSPLLTQDVFATIRPGDSDSQLSVDGSPDAWTLELQSDFRSDAEGVEFRQSNFGILGLRVAKTLSVVFGQGTITGADGRQGEQQLFGRPNRWVDYSGPIGTDAQGQAVIEGLTLIDHAENPGHGSDSAASWHVRDDGWIGPSLSRHSGIELTRGETLRCRYLLLVHPGACNPAQAQQVAAKFDALPALRFGRGTKPHQQFQIFRT
ncbi:hypothetical protein FYK55_04540 [Roseiconus nitratireducens]|uniref:Methane monooxygenase PmoA-like n=1 Tax=Roseiconus nitratireducens TaxID=2605748 RepID=A0A5M6DFA5_9BACT|nr:PmoA family protein [Roseiconus nitratireducens]KAA5546168.1 hypothetical protein FYK55_04540 [Roseiconus nitratireducens]